MKHAEKKKSTFFRYVRYITDYLYHVIRQSVFGRLFSSYDALNNSFSGSAVGKLGTGSGKVRRTIRQNIADAMENNMVVRALCWLRDRILSCGLRTFGLFFVIVGVYSSMMFWLSNYVWQVNLVSGISFIAGIACAGIGVLLLFSDLSLGYAILHGFLIRSVMISVLDISDDTLEEVPKFGRQYYVLAVPIAMVFGSLFALFRPLAVLAAVLYVAMVNLPSTWPTWARMTLNTGLITIFLIEIFHRDMKLSALPIVGKYFRSKQRE